MTQTIGFVGVGRMGTPIARRFSADGYHVHVHGGGRTSLEPLRADGITVHDTLNSLLDETDVVILSLPRPSLVIQISEKIALHCPGRDLTVIDTSTCGFAASRTAAATLESAGVGFLDAPISGGVSGAANGTLAVMVAGSEALFVRLGDVLRTIGKRLFYVGPQPGQGQVIKVVNNILSLNALAATAEATTVAVKSGIPLGTTIAILNAGTGRNSATEDTFPASILSGTYNAGYSTSGAIKDTALYQEAAETLGVPTVIGSAVVQAWQEAAAQGYGAKDFSHIYRLFQERTA